MRKKTIKEKSWEVESHTVAWEVEVGLKHGDKIGKGPYVLHVTTYEKKRAEEIARDISFEGTFKAKGENWQAVNREDILYVRIQPIMKTYYVKEIS